MINPIENKVLVLNRLWQPVHMCSAKRAIGLLFLGHAQAVGMFGEERFATYDFESWLGVEERPEDWPVVGTVTCRFVYPQLSFYHLLIACQEMRLNFPGTTFFREMIMYVSIAKKV